MFFKKEPLTTSYYSELSKRQKQRVTKRLADYCDTDIKVLQQTLILVNPQIYFVHERIILLSNTMQRLRNEIVKINRTSYQNSE